jgi:hypothetical protein
MSELKERSGDEYRVLSFNPIYKIGRSHSVEEYYVIEKSKYADVVVLIEGVDGDISVIPA